ncbi:MAG: 2-phosphosulfolactate phosphatase [Bacteroidia bacterium]|nr:2-phosphosulfolactate phosphatase [Bacteroidia bacterium]
MPSVEVCFSPALYPLFHDVNKVVVVADILRATSAIVTAIYHGAEKIIPVRTVQEALEWKKKGYLAAAERDGLVAEGFELGNSPFGYMKPEIEGKTIVLTTTNGTKAIMAAKDCKGVYAGAFLNLEVLSEHLIKLKEDVLVLCAGWKDKFNLEDSLFAGALTEKLVENGGYKTICDSAIASVYLYRMAEHNMMNFLEVSSHRNRLRHLNLDRDVEYCLTENICPVLVKWNGDSLQRYDEN